MLYKRLLFLLFIGGIAGKASSQSFVYRPNNPNFGGNTFNYAWMLSSATAQDRTVDPASKRTNTSTDTRTNTLDSYAQSLQNQLLNRITNNLIGQQFGESTLKPGTYTFGDFRVEIANGTQGVVVRIVDGKGGETSITVPYF
ncbi:curli production assembly protein CsgF [Siphonobacter sp. BAB-5405]|uniref:curli production assembly/transport component CsgF n=1 Tax=Siphonobacter sp. BAB-5405 TaxID=1864825 RepID=UPI000C80AB41|nr:curli production assembly/transport component CsgF [Siphonobacter sp. BAB-5405]PMD92478.1 curli production assembly protein CsgF [Siphonobacter sp. BAB-5405]